MYRKAALGLGVAGALSFFASAEALADTVTFKNGHEVHGRLVEETNDYIIFQVGNGKLKFLKREIATFTENADYGQRYFNPRRGGDDSPTSQASGGRTWREPKDANAEERRDLKAVHARMVEEYKKVGGSPAERQRKLELTPNERASLDAGLAALNAGGRGAEFASLGIKAIPFLSDALLNGSTGFKGLVAASIADAVTRGDPDEMKWALGFYKVATRLGTLLELAGEDDSANARNTANRTLELITSSSASWPDSKETFVTDGQRLAITKWRELIKKSETDFEASEKTSAEARKKLDDLWAKLEDARDWRKALVDAIDAYGTAPIANPDKPLTPEEAAREASPEEKKAVVEAKSGLKKTLETTVGISADERKKKYALSSEEKQGLEATVQSLGSASRRGSSNLIRQNAANELTGYGLRATEILANCLSGANLYARWSAAGAFAALAGSGDSKEDNRAVLFGYDVPSRLASMLADSSDERSGFMRADAAKALNAILGMSVAWPEKTEQAPTPEEAKAAEVLSAEAGRATSEFKRVEEAREEHRRKLSDLLKKLDRPNEWREALKGTPLAISKAEKDLGKK